MKPRPSLPVLLDRDPAELVVHDEEEPCPYIESQRARMPLRLPLRPISASTLDSRLAAGDRRHGRLLYQPSCPHCRACEPIRIPVRDFTFGRGHRRIVRRAEPVVTTEIGPPIADAERVALYEKHKRERNLCARSDECMDLVRYRRFLVEHCFAGGQRAPVFEMRHSIEGRLCGVAITDRGSRALSAVYCYYDPAHANLSLGTYSILKQIELCAHGSLDYLYLGLYVANNPHMAYKARFLPHERLIEGTWQRFERAAR